MSYFIWKMSERSERRWGERFFRSKKIFGQSFFPSIFFFFDRRAMPLEHTTQLSLKFHFFFSKVNYFFAFRSCDSSKTPYKILLSLSRARALSLFFGRGGSSPVGGRQERPVLLWGGCDLWGVPFLAVGTVGDASMASCLNATHHVLMPQWQCSSASWLDVPLTEEIILKNIWNPIS